MRLAQPSRPTHHRPKNSADTADALIALAWRHVEADEPARAASVYEQLRRFRPVDARLLCNLSYLYERSGELELAEDRAREAVRLAPGLAEGWNNLGIALREQHRLNEAFAAFDRAVVEQSGFALAKFNRATTALLTGDYRRGWPGYDERERLAECVGPRPRLPRWHSEPLMGRPLVVYSEQGAGDAIQFARFLPELQSRADGPVWLMVSRGLQRLFRSAAGVERMIENVADCPADAVAISLGSLPGLLELEIDRLPWRERYLSSPPSSPQLHQCLNDVPPGQRRVGLAWQGNPRQGRDHVRSCSLQTLQPLTNVPDVTWFSLQVGDAARQLADVCDWPIADLVPRLHDFAETAAAIAQLDLVITVDTAVAHLAGALGRPAWVLLCHTPDWRWGLTGAHSPWYPSLRLFRQSHRGDWNGVVDAVRREFLAGD